MSQMAKYNDQIVFAYKNLLKKLFDFSTLKMESTDQSGHFAVRYTVSHRRHLL